MKRGFALPTVLIATTVMIFVLFSALAAAASMSGGLREQYYSKIAREAAESGIIRARECLLDNNFELEWKTVSLHPNNGCSGGAECDNASNCYMYSDQNIRTKFTVSTPTTAGSSSQIVTSTGTVEVLRSSGGKVWQTYDYMTFALLAIDLNFNSVVFGYHPGGAYFFAIAADGTLRAVGNNTYGQLGISSTSNTTSPIAVTVPAGVTPKSVFASFLSMGWNTYIISSAGDVYGSGLNGSGQLGDGSMTSRNSYVKFNLPGGIQAKHVSVLGRAAFVLTENNNLYSAGECTNGLLGYTYTISGCVNQSTPRRVALPAPNVATPNTIPTNNISSDAYTTVLRMEGGRVYVWGGGLEGQLANGTNNNSSTPVKVGCYGDAGCPKAVKVATDGVSTYVLDDTGKLMGSGSNSFGQLGDGTTVERNSLVEFALPSSATGKIIDMSTDQWYVSVLTDTGEVWSAGLNNEGQLGDGTLSNRSTPVKFPLPSGVKAQSIWATSRGINTPSYNNLYVIGDNGRVYAAGNNVTGQLGRDPATLSRSAVPLVIPVINGTSLKAKEIRAGLGTVVILADNGRIYTFGNNSHGQLGDGTTNNSFTPKANRYTNILPPRLY